LIDKNFNIHLNDVPITIYDLDRLAERSQFLWRINDLNDPFIKRLSTEFDIKEQVTLKINKEIKGFVASVTKSTYLKVLGTEEKASIDLFVNGRLRERDILKHIPTTRVPESYLFGQIHFNILDDEFDRFATSREGIKVDDPKFEKFLDILKTQVINKIINQWDKWRLKHRESGDSDNMSITPKARKARDLFNVVSKDYTQSKKSDKKRKVDQWVDDLADDAEFNFASYAECFISENLIRKYIVDNGIDLSKEANIEINKMKTKEQTNKNSGNISIDIRRSDSDLCYLSMDDLAKSVNNAVWARASLIGLYSFASLERLAFFIGSSFSTKLARSSIDR
jgi:hypothetical protein